MIGTDLRKETKSRYSNPPHSSKLIQSSIFQQPQKIEQFTPKSQKVLSRKSYSNTQVSKKYDMNAQLKERATILPKIDSNIIAKQKQTVRSNSRANIQFFQDETYKKIQSMKKWQDTLFYSSNQVFKSQQKNYDIIKGTGKKVKSQLNIFPSFNLQRFDNEYQKRQAFIKGDMELIRKFQEQSIIKRNRTGRNFGSEQRYSYLRKNLQPVDFAFKITQNPEIVSKKLMLQK